ncbi:MAG: LacI family transcriptional regulator, partial [Blastochloris sp.]|nr:LacI family transcriptional regulator [Blastochloris sp.]
QLSIVGYDDIDLTREVRPRLTSVHVDKALMGMMSVRLLRDRAEDMTRTSMTVTLHTQLVVRSSVSKPRT